MSNHPSYQIIDLGEQAGFYKGGRSYVHGTDIIPAIESQIDKVAQGYFLSKISFLNPLQSEGVLFIGSNLIENADKAKTIATGELSSAGGEQKEFLLSDTPIPIRGSKSFDEHKLNSSISFNEAGESIIIKKDDEFTFYEHISIGMKQLCEHLAPQHTKWWFGKFAKSQKTLASFQEIEIIKKRATLGRLITASVVVDTIEFGICDFVGTSK